MVLQQRICRFCSSVRALSSFQAICNFSCRGDTVSRPWYFGKRRPILSNHHFYSLANSKQYLHDYKGKFHTSSYYESENDVLKVPEEAIIRKSKGNASNVDDTRDLYKSIIKSFPDGIQMAFAYGSGAIEQDTIKDKSGNMLDFIFVVDQPKEWHERNLKKHPNHYSFLKNFGPDRLAQIQESYGAGVYFNTLVPMRGRLIKYGVISTARLITDLLDWESLYISGRLHKPVSLITLPKDEHLLEALVVNLQNAVHTALLLLPDTFTEEQFYLTIAGISYSGDVRMALAEDSNKVRNIVRPNIWAFRRMYLPIVMREEHVLYWQEGDHIEQALTFESRHHHLTQLPCKVIQGLVLEKYEVGMFPDMEEIIVQRAFDKDCGKHVSRSIRNIVKSSSASQTIKGIFTAGVIKSVRYGLSKVAKKVKSV